MKATAKPEYDIARSCFASDWQLPTANSYLYDSWNLVGSSEISNFQSQMQTNNSWFVWGLDLSGSLQGAGGVGGLLAILSPDSCLLSPVFDANGNVSEMLSALSSELSILAHYEYSPFGETIVATGEFAKENPYRFSTKYTDDETKLVYYGYRFLSPDLGRWINRDPIGEAGFQRFLAGSVFSQQAERHYALNYLFVRNNPVNHFDVLGLDECPEKCCDGKLVQLVEIWKCDRRKDSWLPIPRIGPIMKHSYVCCSGENKGCYGVQKKDEHGDKYKEGDPIPEEGKATGKCEMRCVSPDEKSAVCGDQPPEMPWDYSICKGQHCQTWANDVTTTECK